MRNRQTVGSSSASHRRRLGFFQGLLQDEIDHFGEWRYHEFQPDEVLDFIDEDLDKLGQWLSRMTNTPLPTQ